jgi:hypothetical protein
MAAIPVRHDRFWHQAALRLARYAIAPMTRRSRKTRRSCGIWVVFEHQRAIGESFLALEREPSQSTNGGQAEERQRCSSLIVFRLTSNIGRLTINLEAHFIQLCKLIELSTNRVGKRGALALVQCRVGANPDLDLARCRPRI